MQTIEALCHAQIEFRATLPEAVSTIPRWLNRQGLQLVKDRVPAAAADFFAAVVEVRGSEARPAVR